MSPKNDIPNINPDTLVDLLRSRAELYGDKEAFSFLADGNKKKTVLTYADLDRKVRAFASVLQKKGLTGERALLLYPPGLDYLIAFFGCLYAGVIAVPAYPPDPNRLNRTLPRLQAIVSDAQATMALTNDSIMYMIKILKLGSKFSDSMSKVPFLRKFKTTMNHFSVQQTGLASANELGNLQWISSDDVVDHYADSWKKPEIDKDSIAFLQYTSGSTGSPKGVMLTHDNLITNSGHIYNGFGMQDIDRVVSWLPMYHDMGLIGGIIQPIYRGIPTTVLSPIHFLQRPLRWLETISDLKEYRIASGGPNFGYDLCARKATEKHLQSLELSNWKVAFSGAEPVRQETIERFYDTFNKNGFKKESFLSCYGLAEATLYVTGVHPEKSPQTLSLDSKALQKNQIAEVPTSHSDATIMTSCGYAQPEQAIAIIDPKTGEKVSDNMAGEVWIKGPNISQGYWGKKELSNETFNNFIKNTNDGPYLSTGDLGYLSDNELYITGRVKDLIIIRGRNYYPQDIEFLIESGHEDVKPGCSAAFSITEDSEEHLVVVCELRQKKNIKMDEVVSAIRHIITETNDIRVYGVILIKAKSISKTSSGKIQRHAVKNAYLNNELKILHEWHGASTISDSSYEQDLDHDEEIKPPQPVSDIIPETQKQNAREIEDWIINHLSESVGVDKLEIDINKPFVSFGLDSAQAIGMVGDLEEWIEQPLSPTIIWDYPSITTLSAYLAGEGVVPAPVVSKKLSKDEKDEPIAVIGMGCRFPGADNPEQFWDNLKNGIDSVIEVPKERWDIDELYDPNPDTIGKMVSRHGGFLKNVDQFDPHFFGVSPREATEMDPQQRLLLEVFWETLENAGIQPEKIRGSNTGVFVGIGNYDYSHFNHGKLDKANMYSGTGNAICITANRISYLFDLRGPSVAMDTACSSSLVSTHLACKSLQRGETEMAVAGGVNLILAPDVNIALSKARMLAPHGRCKTFDADAQGYVRSEGVGVVLLKRLSDAKRDGDNILALIRGSATNQDGHSNGITAPNRIQQVNVIREAMNDANITPDDVSMFEAHGTGTSLGDPIEIQALTEVFENRSKEAGPIAIGSVKTNVGHLEAAAGIIGMIKIILAMQHKTIPAHLHFNSINPRIPFDENLFKIPVENMTWEPNGKRRIAEVSSFGFGGANAHMVLEEAPPKIKRENDIDRPQHILKLSAKGDNALKDIVQRYIDFTDANPNTSLANLCYSSNKGRSSFQHRLSVTAATTEDLNQKLKAIQENFSDPALIKNVVKDRQDNKVAFMFTGQGAQYVNMGKSLYETQPAFKAALDACDAVLTEYLEKPLLSVIFPEDTNDKLINETAYTQPALFAIEYALAELWISWGIKPDYVIGHSVGEYVAATIAGVFSLEDGLKLIATRGRLMQSLPHDGDMAAIFAAPEEISKAIAGMENDISIAGVNGPGNTVISGKKDAVKKIVDQFAEREIKTRLLTVSHAFHSPLMEPILDEFEKVANEISYKPSKIAIVSNLTGDLLGIGQTPDAKYWRDHIRQGVQFNAGMQTLAKEGVNIFVETGPHPTLTGMGKFALSEHEATWVPSIKRDSDDWDIMLQGVGQLYVNGLEISWDSFDRYFIRQFEQIPNYAFQKKRFWINDEDDSETDSGQSVKMIGKSGDIHPLLGERFRSPVIKDVVFEARFNTQSLDILDDHRIFGVSLIPATGYMEMALAAANKAFGAGNHKVENLGILEAIPVPEEGYCTVQVTISKDENDKHFFQIYSQQQDEDGQSDPDNWTINAAGNISVILEESESSKNGRSSIADLQSRNKEEIDVASFYGKMHEHGFEHGKSLQVIRKMWRGENEAFGWFKLQEKSIQDTTQYHFHPALTDAGTQLLAATLSGDAAEASKSGIFLPVGIEHYKVHKEGASELWCHIKRRSDNNDKNILLSDLHWYDEEGVLIAEMIGLRHMHTTMNSLPKAIRERMDNWLYESIWRKENISENGKLSGKWLLLADSQGLGQKLSAAINENGGTSILVETGDSFKKIGDNCWQINFDENADYAKLLNEAFAIEKDSLDGIIHMLASNYVSTNDLALKQIQKSQKEINKSLLLLVQNLATTGWVEMPKLVVLSQNGQAISGEEKINIEQGSIWGLTRVLAMEHPELQSLSIDLEQDKTPLEKIIQELASGSIENQVAFRDDDRFVQRLVRSKIDSDASASGAKGPMRLDSSKKGLLDNLQLVPMERQSLPKGAIEIKVHATGLNFRDVLNALDLYPGDPGPLGGECSGTVTAISEGVTNVKVGDEVMGIAGGSFASYVITWADLVVVKPKNLSHEEAATIPITFLTAHYALNHLAKIKKGDKVFIHAASGGVGQAAIQLAKAEGAVIFGTAGNDEKRKVVKELGADYVMNSRSLDYADEVKEITDGKGVDVLLNSLNGDYIPKNLDILSEKGSFLEIGKVDIWSEVQIKSERADLAYHIIALDHLSETEPAFVSELFAEIAGKFESGELKPLQLKTYSINEAESAFRFMMAAKHIGKVVIRQELDEEPETDIPQVKEIDYNDGSYLITGGLGALGLHVAKWLIDKGTKNLMLMSRRSPSGEVKETIESFEKKGVAVKVVNADVSDLEALKSAINTDSLGLPAIKGIFHAAGLLDDGVLMQQNWERFEKVMAPKVTGSWNLHEISKSMDLDFFVYFSSAASMLGSPGQGNYAAANAFMDTLSWYRREHGLPATSINWGPWSSSGMAATTDMSRRNSGGMGMISPEQGLQMMERILAKGNAQVGVLPIQWKAFLKQFPGDTPVLYSEFAGTSASASDGPAEKPEFLSKLEEAEVEMRLEMMTEFLKQQTVRVLGMEANTAVDSTQPLQSMGLDSLMAIELKNSIDSGVGKNLPATMVFNYPTIDALASYLLTDVLKLSDAEETPEKIDEEAVKKDEALSEIEDLSDEEAEAMLLKSLEEDDDEEEF
ncbi:MAG: SDR family NAD(P)-dependent oxidoreductase [Calditrichaeota bacterium]|nr:MAG: SDR family NAD(P)-dependent oxidoreductase [Calditrichota bacterium]MBL1204436.1 SDR family NAD(P)-dependent oxidoreductase [Calditrichota bacterium]NOG44265.1 SDR family NAD(P)-dependent oxidoreductase [Calditrichota bacterium]